MTDYSIRRGPYGKPWVTRDYGPLDWPEFADKPLNAELYDRPSDVSGNLDTKENLSPYHQCQAVTGLMLDKALAVQFKALVAEHGIHTWSRAKREAKELLAAARMAGGEEYKSGIGSALHRYTVLRDQGTEIEPDHLAHNDFEPWLEVYEEAMAGYEVLDWEGFSVCDDLDNPGSPEDLRCAGNWDKLVRDKETGEVLIADLKTGASDNEWAMKPTIQIGIYAHSQRYDQETGRRWPIHEDLSHTKGLLIHLPYNGGGTPECCIYPLDLKRGWELAKQSVDITEARKIRAYKRDAIVRVKAST